MTVAMYEDEVLSVNQNNQNMKQRLCRNWLFYALLHDVPFPEQEG